MIRTSLIRRPEGRRDDEGDTDASDVAIKEKRARTVRLHDVPTGMQEGLLQQALEKIVPVRRLELFTKTHHAQAELENQAVSLDICRKPDDRMSESCCFAESLSRWMVRSSRLPIPINAQRNRRLFRQAVRTTM
jgi:hypothetical protein